MTVISGFLDFLAQNTKEIAAGVAIALASAGIVLWFIRWLKDRRDTDKVYKFLVRSSKERGWSFRTTHAISVGTKLPESRVSELCRRDKRIRRNDKQKESWRLV